MSDFASSTSSASSFSLSQLGWRPFYSQQLTLEDLETSAPARISAVHRSEIRVLCETGDTVVTASGTLLASRDIQPTVGDWVLIERTTSRFVRFLERASLIARGAAGTQQRLQTIAANVDSLFVVTSCNADFNTSRLERYLTIAMEACVTPIIILTKSDLCPDTMPYLDECRRIAPEVEAVPLNAHGADIAQVLTPWLAAGQTVACVGSSGVGKSTLANTLAGCARLSTGAIREDDAKGRHTTTARQLIAIAGDAWLIDTPGMRELKIGPADTGVRAVFQDIEALARACSFRDCRHRADKGCALTAAVTAGTLDERRFQNYMKLQREAAHAARTVHERHAVQMKFGRMHKTIKQHQRSKRGPE